MISNSRQSKAYIPRLSIVAKCDGMVVGHVALMKAYMRETKCDKTCLVMVSHYVLPQLQEKGVGNALMESIHLRAKAIDYKCITLMGDAEYYQRFGYVVSADLSVAVPPDGILLQPLIKELVPGSMINIKGVVDLPKEYGFTTNTTVGIY